jgi:hypothetical protein
MLSVVMLSCVMLSVVLLSVIVNIFYKFTFLRKYKAKFEGNFLTLINKVDRLTNVNNFVHFSKMT